MKRSHPWLISLAWGVLLALLTGVIVALCGELAWQESPKSPDLNVLGGMQVGMDAVGVAIVFGMWISDMLAPSRVLEGRYLDHHLLVYGGFYVAGVLLATPMIFGFYDLNLLHKLHRIHEGFQVAPLTFFTWVFPAILAFAGGWGIYKIRGIRTTPR